LLHQKFFHMILVNNPSFYDEDVTPTSCRSRLVA
jgi:hypothetical protein